MAEKQAEMARQENSGEASSVVVSPTKSGNGFKMKVNGAWLFTSRQSLQRLLDEGGICVFGTIASGN